LCRDMAYYDLRASPSRAKKKRGRKEPYRGRIEYDELSVSSKLLDVREAEKPRSVSH